MKVIESPRFKKDLRNKKLQNNHKQRISKIIDFLVGVDNFKSLESSSIAKLYKFERLKYELNAHFSFRVDNKEIRLIVKPNTVENYIDLHLEKELLVVCISMKHYKDI